MRSLSSVAMVVLVLIVVRGAGFAGSSGSGAPLPASTTADVAAGPASDQTSQVNLACKISLLSQGSDTWLSAETPAQVKGADPKLTTDGTPRATALVRWDLSTLPRAMRVARAMILLTHVEKGDESGTVFQLYPLRREWSEADATWEVAAPGVGWAAAGASDPMLDRGNKAMGQTPLTKRAPAQVRIELNPDGLAQIQRWVDGTEPNYGIVFQDYMSGDAFRFASFESNHPPRLVLNLCP